MGSPQVENEPVAYAVLDHAGDVLEIYGTLEDATHQAFPDLGRTAAPLFRVLARGSHVLSSENRRTTAKGPAETAISPDHGPTTPQEGTAMDAASNTTAPARPAMAPAGFGRSIDDFSYALSDLRMFSSILETLAETKLEGLAVPKGWNLPAEFKGTVLLSGDLEQLLFLVLKVDNMARKLDDMWGALLADMPAVEERAA